MFITIFSYWILQTSCGWFLISLKKRLIIIQIFGVQSIYLSQTQEDLFRNLLGITLFGDHLTGFKVSNVKIYPSFFKDETLFTAMLPSVPQHFETSDVLNVLCMCPKSPNSTKQQTSQIHGWNILL